MPTTADLVDITLRLDRELAASGTADERAAWSRLRPAIVRAAPSDVPGLLAQAQALEARWEAHGMSLGRPTATPASKRPAFGKLTHRRPAATAAVSAPTTASACAPSGNGKLLLGLGALAGLGYLLTRKD